MSATLNPILVRAADAEVLEDGPTSLITLLTDAGVTDGALTANRATLRRGSPGAPSHFHTEATELFLVLDGSLEVLAGEEVFTLEKYDFIVIPPNQSHAFAPTAGKEAEMLVVLTPGKARFDYYRLLERVYRGEADPNEIGASSQTYDNHYIQSEVWDARP